MTDREKLIDLIINAKRTDPETGSFTEYLEDFLLGYGVKLPDDRPVSREQVKKVWKGEWIGMTDDDGCTWYECSQCEHDLDSLEVPNHFCPACGAPMTDEAVEMVMERMEEMKNG